MSETNSGLRTLMYPPSDYETGHRESSVPLQVVRELGATSMGGANRVRLPESPSLLTEFNFQQDEIRRVGQVVERARRSPKVQEVNRLLHDLARNGSADEMEFAQEVLIHQNDVAELAVSVGLRMGCTEEEVVDLAYAGLTHDGAKGHRDLLGIFMKRGAWTQTERDRTNAHPVLAAQWQKDAGFNKRVVYLTERHHMDLLPDPSRNVRGGYGGESVEPPVAQSERWQFMAHLFSASDHVAANMRARVYKPGMTATEAVGRLPKDLCTPDIIMLAFAKATTSHFQSTAE